MQPIHLHLLLPFSLTPAGAEGARRLPPLPALERLLARAALVERESGEEFSRALPHERWLAQRFGLSPAAHAPSAANAAADLTPFAPYMMLAEGADPGTRRWACVQPVSIEVANDHLLLHGVEALGLDSQEAVALLAEARLSFDAAGLEVVAPTPLRWYVSGAALGHLDSASVLRAGGRSIDLWLPHDVETGERSRTWLKLQNEIQMAWYEHPVNQAREARGALPASSVWLHAQGALGTVTRPFDAVFSHALATRGLALASGASANAPPTTLAALLAAPPQGGEVLVELDTLAAPILAQDIFAWREAFEALEREWFAPAAAALAAGQLGRVDFTFAGETACATYHAEAADRWKIWRRQSLLTALSE